MVRLVACIGGDSFREGNGLWQIDEQERVNYDSLYARLQMCCGIKTVLIGVQLLSLAGMKKVDVRKWRFD